MEIDGSFVMPWGKHRGQALEEIPSSYLRWLANNCDDEEIACAAENEFEYRTGNRAHFED